MQKFPHSFISSQQAVIFTIKIADKVYKSKRKLLP